MTNRLWTAIKLMVSYFLPLIPCCPSIGRLGDGDCIFVQSFGRGSISDRTLGGVILELRHRAVGGSNKNDILFRQLKAREFRPGESNYALAHKVMTLWSKKILPAMIQWEVAYAVWEINPKCYVDLRDEIHCLWPPENGYYPTRDVKRDSCVIMKARGLNRPIEICHPAMKARAVAISWRLGVKVIVEQESSRRLSKNRLWVWDSNSVQPWTRRFFSFFHPVESWLVRETFARYVHHPWMRWVSFFPPQ